MLSINTQTFIGCDTPYENADVVLFGAPYDGTTSFRPGTRFGPRAIRSDSFGIETYSPYRDRDLNDLRICDTGDLELPFGSPVEVLKIIENTAAQILRDGKLPFMLGGEHLVTLGAVNAALSKYPGMHIIHFDAHADLRDEYLGDRLSHATVMRRIWDCVGDGRIHQFGIRSGDRDEFAFAREHTRMTRFTLEGINDALKVIGNAPVYLSLDLDVLDPSIFPGTGTPEHGGVTFMELHGAITKLSRANVVACDVNELSPVYDPSGISTAAACKIIREILLAIAK